MKKHMRFTSVALTIILAMGCLVSGAVSLPGQISSSYSEIYPGVTATEYYLAEGGKYSENGPQFLRVLEFDPKQEDLAFDVVMAGEKMGELKPLSQIIDEFNETNNENKTVIAGINGDLWTQASHHSRVEGESDDPVVKKELCLPRGFTMIDGEIITTNCMPYEKPFDDYFYSFGIASDGTPYLGDISVSITARNLTQGVNNIFIDGINRLPAEDALVMYTDKGPISNYALDDAYEVVIDCTNDYTVRHGERLTGKVTAVSAPGEERYAMQENRLILTARGTAVSKIENMQVGDSIAVTVKVNDMFGNSEVWREMTECIGGHVPVVMGGEACTESYSRSDPMTLLGFKADGTVVMIVNDGRQEGYSIGINRLLYEDLCIELGIDTAFMLDGGGSTTMIELSENGYELTNRPSDYYPDGVTQGCERSIVNAVLLSYVKEDASAPGDIDGDGEVTMLDLFNLKLFIKQKDTPTSEEVKAGDIDGDGELTMVDSFELKYRISKGFWRE
ncbi:MAG: phosphodiester glycosidase family protein [Clostridia bacterium]|nr:phosphodiester glycosidase family protein [Clostridia bacterium]